MNIQPGTRYSKNGVELHVDIVKDGKVYYRKWLPGVEEQGFFENLFQAPLDVFVEQTKDAEVSHGTT